MNDVQKQLLRNRVGAAILFFTPVTWGLTISGAAILALVTSCRHDCDSGDSNPKEQAKQQGPATITINLTAEEPPIYVTIKAEGFLTDTQWAGLSTKIQTAFQASYDAGDIRLRRMIFYNVFFQNKTKIVVEKTSSYPKWSVTSRYLIHFNYDYLKSLSPEALVTALTEAVTEMSKHPGFVQKANNNKFAMNREGIRLRNYAVNRAVKTRVI